MRRLIGGLAIGLVAASLAACSVTGSSSTPSPSIASAGGAGGTLDGTNWVLKTYLVSGTATAVPSGVKVDAHFTASTISGFGGCNAYNGPATVAGAAIKIGRLLSTQMACAGPSATVEPAYFAALGQAATFTAATDGLTIFDASAKPILVYSPGPTKPLEGSWNITGYYSKNGVHSPQVGSLPTAVFTGDAVSGSTGCNDYSGPYTLTGTTVKIGPLATTRKACDQALSDQETAILTALQAATTFDQSGSNVTLKNTSANQIVLAAK